jgi:dTDP-4-dehydrorhamnose reductase
MSIYAKTKLEGERNVRCVLPDALIARINLFGWSLLGKRSLGEWFYYNLEAGNPIRGFTDVLFCPLDSNEISEFLLRMMKAGLTGLYHVVGGECISKYEFGMKIAKRFNLDPELISPASVDDHGLSAPRSHSLCLDVSKVERALDDSMPDSSSSIDSFYTAYQQGYPQQLRSFVDNSSYDLNPYRKG